MLAGVSPAKLTEAQQSRFVSILQSSRCMCGCRWGSYLQCLRADPTCPRRAANIRAALMAAQ
jgi:hypothetical protein